MKATFSVWVVLTLPYTFTSIALLQHIRFKVIQYQFVQTKISHLKIENSTSLYFCKFVQNLLRLVQSCSADASPSCMVCHLFKVWCFLNEADFMFVSEVDIFRETNSRFLLPLGHYVKTKRYLLIYKLTLPWNLFL